MLQTKALGQWETLGMTLKNVLNLSTCDIQVSIICCLNSYLKSPVKFSEIKMCFMLNIFKCILELH